MVKVTLQSTFKLKINAGSVRGEKTRTNTPAAQPSLHVNKKNNFTYCFGYSIYTRKFLQISVYIIMIVLMARLDSFLFSSIINNETRKGEKTEQCNKIRYLL